MSVTKTVAVAQMQVSCCPVGMDRGLHMGPKYTLEAEVSPGNQAEHHSEQALAAQVLENQAQTSWMSEAKERCVGRVSWVTGQGCLFAK